MTAEPNLPRAGDASSVDPFDHLMSKWRLLAVAAVLGGVAGLGGSYLVKPTFTANASFVLPQPAGGSAAAALAALGGLASLAESAVGSRSSADQYASLMMSRTLADRMIDQFGLMQVYEVNLRSDARRRLETHTRIVIGRRDGLITVEVDDHEPKRAADMANRYIDELRLFAGQLTLSEAQHRRKFFEAQVSQARDDLLKAQVALQGSGFSEGVLRAEPRSAADAYGRIRAEVTSAEVKLQTLRRSQTDQSPEVQRASAQLDALRAQLARAESSNASASRPEYLSRYREFKYREALFDLFSRQYEAARVDEAREGMTIQVVDNAVPPERKSKPRRAVVAASAGLAALVLAAAVVLLAQRRRVPPPVPVS